MSRENTVTNRNQAYFTFEVLYIISTCLVKVSFCISLLRIATVRPQIYAIYAVLTVTVIFSMFYLVWMLLLCHPVSYFWEQLLDRNMKGHCRTAKDIVPATYAHGVVMCLGDLSLAILPVVLVAKLHLNRQTKVSVAILLALGSMYVSSPRSAFFYGLSGFHIPRVRLRVMSHACNQDDKFFRHYAKHINRRLRGNRSIPPRECA